MKYQYPNWINEFAESIHRLLRNMDLRTQKPLDCFHFHPLYSDLWHQYIYQAIRLFKQRELPFVKAAETFPNPSSVRAIFLYLVCHYNNLVRDEAKVDKKNMMVIFDFLVKILKSKNNQDIFCSQKNIGHSSREIGTIIENIVWRDGRPEISRALGRLYLGANHLMNGLMNDWCTDNGFEVWGPYDSSRYFGTGTILVIREFSQLRPIGLWRHVGKYKYGTVQIYTVYKNTKLKVEYFGCHTIFQGNLAKNLHKYAVKVDNKFIARQASLEQIAKYLMLLSEKQYWRVRQMDFEELKQMCISQEFFQLKDFFQLVGLDYRPHPTIKERVKGKKLLSGVYPLKTAKLPRTVIDRRFGIDNLKKLYKSV